MHDLLALKDLHIIGERYICESRWIGFKVNKNYDLLTNTTCCLVGTETLNGLYQFILGWVVKTWQRRKSPLLHKLASTSKAKMVAQRKSTLWWTFF